MSFATCVRLFGPAIVFALWAVVAAFGITGAGVRFAGFAGAAVAIAVAQVEVMRRWVRITATARAAAAEARCRTLEVASRWVIEAHDEGERLEGPVNALRAVVEADE